MTFTVCGVCSAFILDVDKHAAWHLHLPTLTVPEPQIALPVARVRAYLGDNP